MRGATLLPEQQGILFEFSGNYPGFQLSEVVPFGFVAQRRHGTLPATAA
jgi:hypothetical protein